MNSTSGLGEQSPDYLQRDVLSASVIRRRTLWSVAAAMCLIALAPPALWAQGPLRRLGDRIRERALIQPGQRAGQPLAPGAALQPRRQVYPLQPLSPYAPLPGTAAPQDPRVRVARPPLPPGAASPSGAGVAQTGTLGYRSPGPATGSANYNRARPSAVGVPVNGADTERAYGPAAELVAPAVTELTPPPRARLGAVVDTPPDIAMDGQPPRRRRGAWVTEVLPQSPAEVAGLRAGDLIVAVQGRVITSVRDMVDELSQYAEGDELRIDYARDGALGAAAVTLAGPDGLARQLPGVHDEPAAAAGENRSLLGGIGSIFGGLLGGQPRAESPAPAPQPAPSPQPPPPPQPPITPQQLTPLQPVDGALETLPAPVPEQP